MIKSIGGTETNRNTKASGLPIGSTFFVHIQGLKHLVIKHPDGYLSLTDPSITWSDTNHFDYEEIQPVYVEIKIL